MGYLERGWVCSPEVSSLEIHKLRLDSHLSNWLQKLLLLAEVGLNELWGFFEFWDSLVLRVLDKEHSMILTDQRSRLRRTFVLWMRILSPNKGKCHTYSVKGRIWTQAFRIQSAFPTILHTPRAKAAMWNIERRKATGLYSSVSPPPPDWPPQNLPWAVPAARWEMGSKIGIGEVGRSQAAKRFAVVRGKENREGGKGGSAPQFACL